MKAKEKLILKILLSLQVISLLFILLSPIILIIYNWNDFLFALILGIVGIISVRFFRKIIFPKNKSIFSDLYVSQWGEFPDFTKGGLISDKTFLKECICNDIDKQSPGGYCESCDAVAGYEYNCLSCDKLLISTVELRNDEKIFCESCSKNLTI